MCTLVLGADERWVVRVTIDAERELTKLVLTAEGEKETTETDKETDEADVDGEKDYSKKQ